MKKLKAIVFTAVLASSLMYTTPAEAGKRSGNYVNGDGCLVVWESYYLFGIRWSHSETVFCNDDGSDVQF